MTYRLVMSFGAEEVQEERTHRRNVIPETEIAEVHGVTLPSLALLMHVHSQRGRFLVPLHRRCQG